MRASLHTDTLEEKSKVLRKIDWHIIPLAAWACGLQFVDKVGAQILPLPDTSLIDTPLNSRAWEPQQLTVFAMISA